MVAEKLTDMYMLRQSIHKNLSLAYDAIIYLRWCGMLSHLQIRMLGYALRSLYFRHDEEQGKAKAYERNRRI